MSGENSRKRNWIIRIALEKKKKKKNQWKEGKRIGHPQEWTAGHDKQQQVGEKPDSFQWKSPNSHQSSPRNSACRVMMEFPVQNTHTHARKKKKELQCKREGNFIFIYIYKYTQYYIYPRAKAGRAFTSLLSKRGGGRFVCGCKALLLFGTKYNMDGRPHSCRFSLVLLIRLSDETLQRK